MGGGVVDEFFEGGEDGEFEGFADLEGVGVGEGYCAGFCWGGFGWGGGGGSGCGGGGLAEGGGFVGCFLKD